MRWSILSNHLFYFLLIYFILGVAHCSDGSDEIPHHSCTSNIDGFFNHAMLTKHWRAITIVIFLLLLFIAFTLCVAYFICPRCVHPSISLIHGERKKNYATIVNSRMLKIFIEIKMNFDFIFFRSFQWTEKSSDY
jgi:hypothetical protein